MTDSIRLLQDSIATLQTQLLQAHDTISADSASIGLIRGYVEKLAHDGGFDLWDWVAILIALLSLFVAIIMAYWQYKTERNTTRITKGSQIKLMIGNICHLYNNLVIINAMWEELADRYATHYPSQDHFRKLAIDIQGIHTEGFINDPKKIESINRSRLLIRNYNIEVAVAEQHICSKEFPAKLKSRDFGILIKKQNMFLTKFLSQIENIAGNKYFIYLKDLRESIIREAINRTMFSADFSSVKDSAEVERRKIEIIRLEAREIKRYYSPASSPFADLIFPDDKELFFDLLNHNIHTEINAKNSQNYPKIFIIPFADKA